MRGTTSFTVTHSFRHSKRVTIFMMSDGTSLKAKISHTDGWTYTTPTAASLQVVFSDVQRTVALLDKGE